MAVVVCVGGKILGSDGTAGSIQPWPWIRMRGVRYGTVASVVAGKTVE